VTANWPLSRIVFWIVVIGLVAWVISSPSRAGHTAADLVTTVIGWGESIVSAGASFAANVTT
jgi:hypothetical protein